MRNESLEIFAKHFGDKLDLNIQFEDGATPSTNGRDIILPSNLDEAVLLPMLGALLHETGHIRLTEFNSLPTSTYEQELFRCTNLLEDIRIDHDTITRYPETKGLYIRLIHWVFNRKRDNMNKEPIPTKILKTLYLNSLGLPGYDTKADKIIKTLNLDRFIDLAKLSHSTSQVKVHAKELLQLLYNVIKNPASALTPGEVDQLKKDLQGFQEDLQGTVKKDVMSS